MLFHYIPPWQYLPTLSDETNFFYLYTPSTWFRASWEVRDIPPWRARMIVASSNDHFRSFVSSTVHRIDRVAKVCVHTNDFWFLQPWKESQIFLKICWKVSGYYFNVKNGLITLTSYKVAVSREFLPLHFISRSTNPSESVKYLLRFLFNSQIRFH